MIKAQKLIEKCKKEKASYFYLNQTELVKLPKDVCSLKDVRVMDLSNNKINELPKEIGDLRKLEILDLRNNMLSELPYEISFLNKLETLHLQNNNIKELPVEIVNLSSLTKIGIDGNPITKPPLEVVNRGIRSIKNYFNTIEKSIENIKIYEAKLLIVGEGNVGKTCLMNNILSLSSKTKTTEGIAIEPWEIKNDDSSSYRINIWDFGGQEIYHSTHQFFLTKRSIYVFVWTARTDDNLLSFEYWLNIIKLLGDNPPVIVVQNKIDERIKNIDEQSIKKRFPNVIGFYKVSATNGTNMCDLIDEIKNSLKELDHIGDLLPKVWHDIRTELEALNNEFISYDKYLQICSIFSQNEKQSLFLSQYFHDIGIFLHFQDNPILKNIVFLKPEWATNAVYKLIDTKHIINNYGRFSFDELVFLWDEYPKDYHIHLVELMKKFELCFNLNDTNQYIIPELLDSQPKQYDIIFEDKLSVRFYYNFMPKGIITRLIVRLHDLIKDDLFWKSGLVIYRENTYAEIITDKFKNTLDISISGYDRNGLLNIIDRELEVIHKSLNYPIVSKLIPCTCRECRSNTNPHYYNYSVLKKYQSKGKEEITCPRSIDEINIEYAIRGIEGKLPKGTIKGNSLLKRLNKCPLGKSGWQEFEKIGADIFNYLFEDDFENYSFKTQKYSDNGHSRKDMVVNNNFKNSSSFWGRVFHDYKCKIITIDFKNYEHKLNQNEFLIPSKYLKNSVGQFAIVINRKGIDNGALDLQKRLLNENKLIISIKDLDIVDMIHLKMKGLDPKIIIEKNYFDLLSEN